MFLVQAEKFRWALGHYPDYAERYMVHQQGIQGAIEHYTHPERVAWQSMCATDEGMLKGEQWCRKCIFIPAPLSPRILGPCRRFFSAFAGPVMTAGTT